MQENVPEQVRRRWEYYKNSPSIPEAEAKLLQKLLEAPVEPAEEQNEPKEKEVKEKEVSSGEQAPVESPEKEPVTVETANISVTSDLDVEASAEEVQEVKPKRRSRRRKKASDEASSAGAQPDDDDDGDGDDEDDDKNDDKPQQ